MASSDINPYQSPQGSSDEAANPFAGDGFVPARVIQLLEETRPWVRLIGWLLLIGFVLLIVLGVGLAVYGISAAPGGQSVLFAVVGFVYAVFGILYFFPSRFLRSYAQKIDSLSSTRNFQDLEGALQAQKSFWKFAGIVALVYLVLVVIYIIALIAGGLLSMAF